MYIIKATFIVLMGLVIFLSAACSQHQVMTNTPLIAVLCDSSRSIETISATDMKLNKTINLRSLSIDFTINKKSGLIYTAQCGLAGKDVDDVIGEIDPKKGIVKRYFKLKYPNPSQIVISGNVLYVIHGFMVNKKFVGTRIDLGNNYSSQQFYLPGAPSSITLFSNKVYATMTENGNDLKEYLAAFDLSTETIKMIDLGEDVLLPKIAFDNIGIGYGLSFKRFNEKPVNLYEVVVFNPEERKIIKKIDLSELKFLDGKPSFILWKDNKLFVSFFDGRNLSGNAIAIINPVSGKVEAILEGFDEPSCLLVQDNKLYIGEYSNRRLSVVDLTTHQVLKKIQLGGRPIDLLYVE